MSDPPKVVAAELRLGRLLISDLTAGGWGEVRVVIDDGRVRYLRPPATTECVIASRKTLALQIHQLVLVPINRPAGGLV